MNSHYPDVPYLGDPSSYENNPVLQLHQSKKEKQNRGRRGKKNINTPTNRETQISPPSLIRNIVNIFNLSKYILTVVETSLNKGLSFCPTNKINKFKLLIDLNNFMRKLTMTRHFNICQLTTDTNIQMLVVKTSSEHPSSLPIHTDLKPRSTFYPTHNRGHYNDFFFSLVAMEFRNINDINRYRKNNITRTEKEALHMLMNNPEIIMREEWLTLTDRIS